jgi:phosphatidate cytidylyltransferase
VTRFLSGLILVALAVLIVWFAPPALFGAAALVLLLFGVRELVLLARAGGLDVPLGPAMIASALSLIGCVLAASPSHADPAALPVVLLAQLIAAAALTMSRWDGGPAAMALASATIFPSIYLALPIATMVVVWETDGPPALFLLMLTVIASDTAQYYTGRIVGRRLLAPAISPKKTVEGAAGGFVVGVLVFVVAGAWWLPAVPTAFRALLGVAIVAVGIAGDLFESLLKRSAGVKDSAALIPGHGGALDRVDALLFAAPVYFIVTRYL